MRSEQDPIVIKGLWKSFNGKPVLKGLDLDVRRGETLVVMGRSGGGKSVLLKHMIGLLRPDRGSIAVDGTEITRCTERELDRLRLKFGLLFQEGALFDSMNVFQNVAFALVEHSKLGPEKIRARVAQCLSLVGLHDIELMRPDELSGGMKKRVGLARALAMQPEIMLYDEPTSGVDPLMGQEINGLIKSLGRQLGVTSLVVTHDVESAFSVGDRIALLEDGVIVSIGTPGQFRADPHPLVRRFLSDPRQAL